MSIDARRSLRLRRSRAFTDLVDVSERLGRDALQVQGPGGNTSLKADGVMLVKASGSWLAEARTRDIMVPIRCDALRDALHSGGGNSQSLGDSAFVIDEDNPHGLRPSIETSVHAALNWPVVLHTHCIATLAIAVRTDAQQIVDERLSGLDAIFVRYAKPGLDLARAIINKSTAATRVVVLGNHGLVACGGDPVEAALLVEEVRKRLEPKSTGEWAPDANERAFAAECKETGWLSSPNLQTHAIARDPQRLAIANGATLYPDHAIFLGPGVFTADVDEPVADALRRASAMHPVRKLALFPGRGAAIPGDASPAVKSLARALGDVAARIAPGARLNRLSAKQEAELLDWDAEKYRQLLEVQRASDPMRGEV